MIFFNSHPKADQYSAWKELGDLAKELNAPSNQLVQPAGVKRFDNNYSGNAVIDRLSLMQITNNQLPI